MEWQSVVQGGGSPAQCDFSQCRETFYLCELPLNGHAGLIYSGAVLNKHSCFRALVAIDFSLGEGGTHTETCCKKHTCLYLSPFLWVCFFFFFKAPSRTRYWQ